MQNHYFTEPVELHLAPIANKTIVVTMLGFRIEITPAYVPTPALRSLYPFASSAVPIHEVVVDVQVMSDYASAKKYSPQSFGTRITRILVSFIKRLRKVQAFS